MTTTTIRSIRAEYAENIVLSDIPNIGDGAILECYYGDDSKWDERCIHIGDGVVLGVAADGEYFTALYDQEGRFYGGAASQLDGSNYPAGVVEALNA